MLYLVYLQFHYVLSNINLFYPSVPAFTHSFPPFPASCCLYSRSQFAVAEPNGKSRFFQLRAAVCVLW